jgi:hypothetical protein
MDVNVTRRRSLGASRGADATSTLLLDFCVGCIRQIDKLQAPSSLTFYLKHRSSS